LLFFEFSLGFLVLFGFVIEDIVHDGIESFLRTLGFDFFDGRIEDGILKLFSEAVAEGVVVG
jgi:hypothetical protein